ncbi:unnamed protein product [Closterium sp. NIES-64]|nr:unnamed protein product [Closterium sp. NIES-64]
MAARNASAFQFTISAIDHEFWKDFSKADGTWLYAPLTHPRSNTSTSTHIMGARAAATTVAVTSATAQIAAVTSAAPAATAAKGAPAKATHVTPAAAKKVVVESSPVGSMATKAAAEKVREQGNGKAAHTAVRSAAGKAALGGVEAAGGRAGGAGWGSGRGGGGASGIREPGQSRAATRLQQLRECRLRLTALVNQLLQQQQCPPLAFQSHAQQHPWEEVNAAH